MITRQTRSAAVGNTLQVITIKDPEQKKGRFSMRRVIPLKVECTICREFLNVNSPDFDTHDCQTITNPKGVKFSISSSVAKVECAHCHIKGHLSEVMSHRLCHSDREKRAPRIASQYTFSRPCYPARRDRTSLRVRIQNLRHGNRALSKTIMPLSQDKDKGIWKKLGQNLGLTRKVLTDMERKTSARTLSEEDKSRQRLKKVLTTYYKGLQSQDRTYGNIIENIEAALGKIHVDFKIRQNVMRRLETAKY